MCLHGNREPVLLLKIQNTGMEQHRLIRVPAVVASHRVDENGVSRQTPDHALFQGCQMFPRGFARFRHEYPRQRAGAHLGDPLQLVILQMPEKIQSFAFIDGHGRLHAAEAGFFRRPAGFRESPFVSPDRLEQNRLHAVSCKSFAIRNPRLSQRALSGAQSRHDARSTRGR